jgi:hypothetical protein
MIPTTQPDDINKLVAVTRQEMIELMRLFFALNREHYGGRYTDDDGAFVFEILRQDLEVAGEGGENQRTGSLFRRAGRARLLRTAIDEHPDASEAQHFMWEHSDRFLDMLETLVSDVVSKFMSAGVESHG